MVSSFSFNNKKLMLVSPRRGSRIQKGGSYIQKGGFRTGISGADPNCCRALGKSTSKKKIADSRRGGVPITQNKPLYPRMSPVTEQEWFEGSLSEMALR